LYSTGGSTARDRALRVRERIQRPPGHPEHYVSDHHQPHIHTDIDLCMYCWAGFAGAEEWI
jgi:hypothetical protein